MNIQDFAAHLEKTDTEQRARSLLNDYLASFGIRSYALTYYSGHIKSGRKLRYHCVSEALRPWHMHYIEQAYADVDRTLEESITATLPMLWDVKDQLVLAKNTREQRIREESIEFGISKGLSIPIHGPQQDFVLLTLHQRHNESCLKHYEAKQFEWQSAALIFYHYIQKILDLDRKPTSSYKLTRREEQCLAFTAKSWRVEKIAKELKISERTVNFHIQNANKKLGTNNKYQAVLLLLRSTVNSKANEQ